MMMDADTVRDKDRNFYIQEVQNILSHVEHVTEREKLYLQTMLSDLDMREALLVLKEIILEAKSREHEMRRTASR